MLTDLLYVAGCVQDTTGITVQSPCPSPATLARLAAAARSLADAAHLHIKVLEDTLQTLPAALTVPARRQDAPKAAAAAAGSSCPAQQSKSLSGGDLLVVDGVCAGSELSQGWLCSLMAQADVDLAMSGLLGNS